MSERENIENGMAFLFIVGILMFFAGIGLMFNWGLAMVGCGLTFVTMTIAWAKKRRKEIIKKKPLERGAKGSTHVR